MISQCPKCRRYIPSPNADQRITDITCLRCAVLFKDCNGGIDWKTAGKADRKELLGLVALAYEREKYFKGRSAVAWPQGGLEYVKGLVEEFVQQKEARDGKRR